MKTISLKSLFLSFCFVSSFLFSTVVYAQPQFQIGSVANAVTPTVTIPITVTNFTQIVAIQGSINWDNTKLTFNSVTGVNSTLTGFQSNASVSGGIGRLGYIWTDVAVTAQTLTNGSVLFNLVLNLVPTATGSVSISFSNSPTSLAVADQTLSPITGVIYSPGLVNIPYALPANLSLFTATKNNNAVTLKWLTANEKNTAYFEVERSNNGVAFTSIAKVNAGNGNYSYADAVINSGKSNFYRLKITDIDGRFTYSKTLAVRNDDNVSAVNIYPNPVKDNLSVQIKSSKSETNTVQIVDLAGKVLMQQNVQLSNGSNSFSFNVTNLVNGSYLLIVKGETTQQQQFIKE